ncbi:MAG TPA: sialidase family protein, partial [Candidatus Polarisedimenticolia bacterium]|nr:sialidase family protein [Candidatus Polarisedimenticolia bacterium]
RRVVVRKSGRWAVIALALALGGLLAATGRSGPRAGQDPVPKPKKPGSGLSFFDQTTVSPEAALAPSGFDNERVLSVYDDWEPAVATDPITSYVYQITTRYSGPAACKGCPFPVLIFRSSSDSGATWTAPISFTGKGTKPTWSDKPWLAISKDGQNVYIAFNASDSYVVSSHDAGNTFSAPVKTNNDTEYWFANGGVVAADGTVYFSEADFSQTYAGPGHIDVLKSTNGGASFITTRVDTSQQVPGCPWAAGCTLGFLGSSVALAMDSAGTLMIAYNANDMASAPEQVYVRTSTDGVTWSARQLVSTGLSNVNSGFPALASGPTAGDFRLAFQDDRNGPTTAFNTWYRRTTNGGGTWTAALRLSNLSSGAPYKTAAGYAFPYGDYLEIAVDPFGTSQVAWGEGISYTGPGGTWFTKGL